MVIDAPAIRRPCPTWTRRAPGARGRQRVPWHRVRGRGRDVRRSGVQHRHGRLPGGAHRPVVRGSDRGHDLAPSRQLRGERRRSRIGHGCRWQGSPCARRPAARRRGVPRPRCRTSLPASGITGIEGIDTQASDPDPARTAARCGPPSPPSTSTPGRWSAASWPRRDGGCRSRQDGVGRRRHTTRRRWSGPADTDLGRVFRVAAYDFGIKRNILRLLAAGGIEATVFPAQTPAAEVAAGGFDGVFLSNGPGDPSATAYGIAASTRAAREGADLRDLPGPPTARPCPRGTHLQDEVRASWREPAGEEPA